MPATKKTINSDLERERRNCSFDVEELARYWYGDETKLEEKRARGMCISENVTCDRKVPTSKSILVFFNETDPLCRTKNWQI